jgi:plastocyanin
LKATTGLAAAALALTLLPATAHAQAPPPPLTASYTATDVGTNHFYYATGTTSAAPITIATTGTVNWSYPAGTSRHDVNFTSALKPTACTVNGAAKAPPIPATPTAPGWSGSCRFDTPGTYTFACQLHPSMTGTINVTPAATSTGPSATVPPTLSVTIGPSVNLGQFVLGVASDYTANLGATVTSTAGDAKLSVADPSATAPGHLVNGTNALAQPLQVMATNAAQPSSAFAPVPGPENPLTLLTYAGPISNANVTVNFKQSIGASDPLRTGAYTKSLTFTLSTTNP